MNGKNTFSQTLATPEQILAIFQDWQRLELDGVPDKNEALSFDTTVNEWLDSADFLDWNTVGKGLNEFFSTNFSKDEWRQAMKPENKRTLHHVCVLLSSKATLPVLNETKLLGATCKAASAFFALRARLQISGVDTSEIRPSSKLENFLRLHSQTMIGAILKLAPGKLPSIKTKSNLVHRLFGWATLLCLVALIVSWIFSTHFWTATSCLALLFSFIGVVICSRFPPAKVEIVGLETFADLSRLIADETGATGGWRC